MKIILARSLLVCLDKCFDKETALQLIKVHRNDSKRHDPPEVRLMAWGLFFELFNNIKKGNDL